MAQEIKKIQIILAFSVKSINTNMCSLVLRGLEV